MVFSQTDFQVWTDSGMGREPGVSRLIPEQHAFELDQTKILRKAVSDVRNALAENGLALNRAAEFRAKNERDPTLRGYESDDDNRLLSMIDKLATVASIHADWAEDLNKTIVMLGEIKANFQSIWSADADALLEELRQHLENVEWVRQTTRRWSNEIGEYFDLHHPNLPPHPVSPVDMGPSDSSRLPSVL